MTRHPCKPPKTADQLRQLLIARLARLTGSPRGYWSSIIAEIQIIDWREDQTSNWVVRATCGLHQGAAVRVVINDAIGELRDEIPYVSGYQWPTK